MIVIHETMIGEETRITITEIKIVEAVQESVMIAIETDFMIDITLIAEIDMMNVINMTGRIVSMISKQHKSVKLFIHFRRDRDRRDDRGKFDRRERDRNDDHDRIRNDYDRNRDRNRRNDRDKRANSPRYQNDGRRRDRDGPSNHRDDRKDYGKRSYSNTSPSKSHDEKSISPSHRNQSQDESDGNRQKNTSNVDKPSNYRSRSIERRAQDKVQQLQKLGIEIPTIPPELTALPPPIKQLQPLLLTPLTLSSSTITASVPAVAENPNNEPEPTETNLSINLSNFTSPVLVNPRYTEQMQKKKLIWGSKKVQSQQNNGSSNIALPVTNNKWEKAKFSQDSDGKVASKFLRLMGVKNAEAVTKTVESNADDSDADPNVKKREEMFSSMEQQYEMARHATHTMRGVGLGFGSQARPI